MEVEQKKIIVVFNNLFIGGIERKIVDICNFYSKSNYSVFLLLKSKKGFLLKKISKKILILSPKENLFKKINTLFFPFWLAKQFNKIEPNLIISFGNYCSIASVFGKKINSPKARMIISDDSGLEKQIKRESFPRIRKQLVKITYPIADKIILLTESAKNNLIKLVPKTEDKIVVRENWLPFFFKKKIKNKKQDIDILFLGRFEKQKNPIKFLTIVKILKKFNLCVAMVGYGSMEYEIKKFIKKNNLTKNIKIYKATTEVWRYYQRSRLMILTSDYEGFPLTILESFFYGCVVICNKIPEVVDFFDKYSENLLFDDNNDGAEKIIKLLKNTKKRNDICFYYKKKIVLKQKLNFKKTIDEFQKQL